MDSVAGDHLNILIVYGWLQYWRKQLYRCWRDGCVWGGLFTIELCIEIDSWKVLGLAGVRPDILLARISQFPIPHKEALKKMNTFMMANVKKNIDRITVEEFMKVAVSILAEKDAVIRISVLTMIMITKTSRSYIQNRSRDWHRSKDHRRRRLYSRNPVTVAADLAVGVTPKVVFAHHEMRNNSSSQVVWSSKVVKILISQEHGSSRKSTLHTPPFTAKPQQVSLQPEKLVKNERIDAKKYFRTRNS